MENVAQLIILIIICFILFFKILPRVLEFLIGFSSFEITKITTNQKWVRNAINGLAHEYARANFLEMGRPYERVDGSYRVDFIQEKDRMVTHICRSCLLGTSFSKDFCDFVHSGSKKTRRRELENIMDEYLNWRRQVIKEKQQTFLARQKEVTPQEFFEIRSRSDGDFVGVYIIHNETNNKYYVGQATRVLFRVNQHFTGEGNGDVYADYKYGQTFKIKMIRITDSGYSDLDRFERDMIEKYHAYEFGYNKTTGNGNR